MWQPKAQRLTAAAITMAGLFLLVLPASVIRAEDSLAVRHENSARLLEELRADITLSSREETRLAAEIAELDNDKATLNKKLIETSLNTRSLEQKIDRTSSRILDLEVSLKNLRQSLGNRKSLLSEVLGALQRMGKNPPPALLVTPRDALVSVRSAILLGSVVPEIRSETRILSTELTQMASLSEDIANQRTVLASNLETELSEENRISLLLQAKKKLSKIARENLANQSIKAAKLAARATSLSNLIKTLRTEIDAVNQAAQAALEADEKLKLRQNAQIADARKEVSKPDFTDTSRISPAVGFLNAKGHLIKPVNGVDIRQFGDKDELGDPSPSIAIATRINARVISPADGWVVYSGPFRSYGQLLILNVGSNHHIVMSGMEKIEVELGQFVLVGEPIGIMGKRRIASAGTFDIGSARPVLAIEIRNNNEPIDPAPWWQANTDKRSDNDS